MRRLTLLALFWGVLVSNGRISSAQEPDYTAAKKHFLAGRTLFAEHDFAKAAKEFYAAYEITKDAVLLFNVAEAYEHAGKNEQAIRAYEGYLAGSPKAKDRAAVEAKIKLLEKKRALPPPP